MLSPYKENTQISFKKSLAIFQLSFLLLWSSYGSVMGQRDMAKTPILSSPGFYSLPYTLVPRNFQVETTFLFAKNQPMLPVRELVIPQINMRLGLSNRLELGLQYSIHRIIIDKEVNFWEDETFFPGFQLGGQYNLSRNNTRKVKMALKGSVFLPTNRNSNLAPPRWFSTNLFWLGQIRLSDRFRLITNIGTILDRDIGTPLIGNLAFEGRFGQHWNCFMEGTIVYDGLERDLDGNPAGGLVHGYNVGIYRSISQAFVWNVFGGISVLLPTYFPLAQRMPRSIGTGLGYRILARRNR